LGSQPAEPLTTLAATEAAGILDDDIRARAAGLRSGLLRKQVMNQVKSYPDLAPGQPSGSGDIGRTRPDPYINVEVPQPACNGRPG
jgi:hypothetical protein